MTKEKEKERLEIGIVSAWQVQQARNEGRCLEELIAENVVYGYKETKKEAGNV